MGLLSKIKSMLGFGAKTTAPTQKDARKQGQFKGKKKPFEKKNYDKHMSRKLRYKEIDNL